MGSTLVRFRQLSIAVNGKSKISPSGEILAIKLPVGTQLVVLAEDENWPALENLWLLLKQHLQALRYLDPPAIESEQEHPHADRLTSREQEVANYLAQGLTKAQIAERLTIKIETVRIHCVQIKKKWGMLTKDIAALEAEAKWRGFTCIGGRSDAQ